MEKLEYIIEDRTIAEVLGIQNFTNEESAVLELVKNSFDAQAKNVHINISREQMIIEEVGLGITGDCMEYRLEYEYFGHDK